MQTIVNEEISFKENMKNITKFLRLFKNTNYRKKISKHVEEIFTSLPKYSILHKKEKNKQTKYNTADQVVDMQAVNFLLVKHD